MTTPHPPANPPDGPPDTEHPRPRQVDTPDAAEGRPATVAEQATAALDVAEDVLGVLEEIAQRLTALEHTVDTVADAQQRGAGPEHRADYRFEHYPKADGDEEQAAQMKRARAAWERLDRWVSWLVGTYRLTNVIPPCWADHTTLREELIGLRVAWTGAWSPRANHDAIVVWHERLWNARARLLDGNWGSPRCDGQHTTSHADDQADQRGVTGFDLADAYLAWTSDPHRDHALIVARDRSLATLRANWTNPTDNTSTKDTSKGDE